MLAVKELFNKPEGTPKQIVIAGKASESITTAEAVISAATLVAIGLLPDLAPIVIQVFAIQLIAAGLLNFAYLKPRLNNLLKLARPSPHNTH